MTFKVGLEHFRVFERTESVEIRPITLLTGGNSAGKSSFLAALRYLSDIDQFGSSNNSFNKDPFSLGAYEQIAHYRGGRSGRSKDFSFSYTASGRHMPANRRADGDCSVRILFSKRQSQPTVESITVSQGQNGFSFSYSGDWKTAKVQYSFDGLRKGSTITPERLPPPELVTRNPAVLSFLLESFFREEFAAMSGDPVAQADNIRITAEVSQVVRAAITAIPPTSYVGAPVRSRPARTYDPIDVTPQAEGMHVPSRLAQLSRSNSAEWLRIKKSITDFGLSSSLFNDIEVRSLGRSDSDPFQINVIINGPRRNIIDVGYGVSQALPIVFELLQRSPGSLFIAQQPEVHLHPEAQAALGTLITNELVRRPGYIVVETHSDYLIDRICRHIREGIIKSDDVSLLYFCRQGLSASISHIKIDDSGQVYDAPDSYRAFFLKEQIKNLGFDDVHHS